VSIGDLGKGAAEIGLVQLKKADVEAPQRWEILEKARILPRPALDVELDIGPARNEVAPAAIAHQSP
jgi:hypothetical protein